MSSTNRTRLPLRAAFSLALALLFVLGMAVHLLSLSGHGSDGLPEQSCSLHHGLASTQDQPVEAVENRDCRIDTRSFDGEWLLTEEFPHPPKFAA